jgi:hypothetical protein
MQELKNLLENAPAVKRFNELLAGLPPEEQQRQYHHAYCVSMQQWSSLPKKYQVFFCDLVQHDWQRFLDYLRQETMLGALMCPALSLIIPRGVIFAVWAAAVFYRPDNGGMSFIM